MSARTVDRAFGRFRTTGDSGALALVFDRTAPELLALGRHLASGEAAAEDLVQATFLTAIEDKDSHDGARPVLPWLIGILANHAREARRWQRRALDPMRLAKEQPSDPVAEAEGQELDAELAGAIARLPEPYRPVLRLFLQHGFEPAEIAATLERPDGTVRAQLHRGLDRLRKLLPAGLASAPAMAGAPGRGLQAVRAAVLLRCGAGITAVPTAITIGAIVMMNKKLLLAAAALLLVGGFGYSLFAVPAPASGEPTAAGPRLTGSAPRPGARARVASADGGAAAADLPARVEQPLADTPTTGSVRVRLERAKDHARIAGVGVALEPLSEMWNPTAFRDFVASDAQGEAVFNGLAPGEYFIDVDRVGGQQEHPVVVAGRTAEQVVRLGTGIRVEGSVVDAGGTPVEGAAICLHGSRMGSVTVAHSDRLGYFVCADLTPGVELQARKAGCAPSLAVGVQFASDGRAQVRLQLGAGGCVVTGRVVDESGAPVPCALVAVQPDVPPAAMWADRTKPQVRAAFAPVDAAGNFRCDEVAPGPTLITACARGPFAAASACVTAGDVPAHVEIRLGRGAEVAGTVTDGGAPLADAAVFAFVAEPDAKMGYLGNLLGYRHATTDAEGRYRISGLTPGQLQVTAVDRNNERIGQQTVQLVAGETTRCDVAGGKGAPFLVRIEPVRAPGTIQRWLTILRRLDGTGAEAASAVQLADGQGCAKFPALEQGRYELSVYCEPVQGDLVVVVRRELAVAGSETRVEVPAGRLVLQPVRGRLVDAALAPAGGVTLTLVGKAAGVDLVNLQRLTGADGRFEFNGVPTGRYRLAVKSGESEEQVSDIVVAADREENVGDVHLPR